MVFTPKQADREDHAAGIMMILGIVLASWWAAPGIALVLMGGFDALCIAIDRHLPMDSPHRQTGERRGPYPANV